MFHWFTLAANELKIKQQKQIIFVNDAYKVTYIKLLNKGKNCYSSAWIFTACGLTICIKNNKITFVYKIIIIIIQNIEFNAMRRFA